MNKMMRHEWMSQGGVEGRHAGPKGTIDTMNQSRDIESHSQARSAVKGPG